MPQIATLILPPGFNLNLNRRLRSRKKHALYVLLISHWRPSADGGFEIVCQASVAKEDRQALEAQLRQLQVGLTEGQEAARREGKKEVERLEARVKDLLKDRSVPAGNLIYGT